MPRVCVRASLEQGVLVELPVEEPRANETFWLAWRPEHHRGEALKWWRTRLGSQLLQGILSAPMR